MPRNRRLARTGDIIENPAMGGRVVFRRTARETNGELLQFDFFLKPSGTIAEPHVHPRQEERFYVIGGSMRGRIEGRDQSVAQDDVVVVPPGTSHDWWSDGDDEAHLLVEFRPALRIENFFEEAFALARAGKTDERGIPNIWQRAVLIKEYRHEIYPAFAPRPVVLAGATLLAPIAHLLGYEAGIKRA
jgi:quercetin dioxygenase-like cupin family protein